MNNIISIIMYLSAILIVGNGCVYSSGNNSDYKVLCSPGKARFISAKQEIRSLVTALEAYRLQTGHYPSEKKGLQALLDEKLIRDKKGVLLDPWGNAYVYVRTRKGFVVKSYGADGKPGGKGKDEDISSD